MKAVTFELPWGCGWGRTRSRRGTLNCLGEQDHGTHLGRQALVAGRADVCLCQPKFDGFRPRLHVVVAIQFIPMGGLVVRGAASLARDFGRI